MNKTLLIHGAAILLATCCAGQAVGDEVSASVRVGFADLNLASQAGVDTLRRRIRGAAETVCGPSISLEILRSVEHRRCVADASNRAFAQLRLAQVGGSPK
jgi:UrcA family protein